MSQRARKRSFRQKTLKIKSTKKKGTPRAEEEAEVAFDQVARLYHEGRVELAETKARRLLFTASDAGLARANTLNLLAGLYRRRGQLQKAFDAAVAALEVFRELDEVEAEDLGLFHQNAGEIALELRRPDRAPDRAVEQFEAAARILRQVEPPTPLLLKPLQALASAHQQAGRPAAACAAYDEALAVARATRALDLFARVAIAYAQLLCSTGALPEARAVIDDAIETYETALAGPTSELAFLTADPTEVRLLQEHFQREGAAPDDLLRLRIWEASLAHRLGTTPRAPGLPPLSRVHERVNQERPEALANVLLGVAHDAHRLWSERGAPEEFELTQSLYTRALDALLRVRPQDDPLVLQVAKRATRLRDERDAARSLAPEDRENVS